jgi:hypothetical protein
LGGVLYELPLYTVEEARLGIDVISNLHLPSTALVVLGGLAAEADSPRLPGQQAPVTALMGRLMNRDVEVSSSIPEILGRRPLDLDGIGCETLLVLSIQEPRAKLLECLLAQVDEVLGSQLPHARTIPRSR